MLLERKAELFLVFIVAIWGLTFPLIGNAVKTIDPIAFVFFRFLLATILIFPFVIKQLAKTNKSIIFYSIVLGFCNLIVYVTQSEGLQTIGPNESAFITSVNILFVPVLSLIFMLDRPKAIDFVSAFLGFFGLYVLMGANITGLNHGELLTLLCAIFVALSIVLIQLCSRKYKESFLLFAFYQILFTTVFTFFFMPKINLPTLYNPGVMLSILFCAIFATSLAMILQVKFQGYTTSTKVALIFSLEPFFVILFTWMLFKKPPTDQTLLGGGIIIFSILINDMWFKLRYFLNGISNFGQQ
ncbi:MAG: DMT family transporter [Gammaproteobacteria bacterium]